eukprot:TRINITY_DN399_c0_g2_i1.p1 TRINITY_DN399_c0_g2~~TRINITY_DN399_c0_g2_i1.p1  ORF type:complete len:443 (-),score=102.43 TRINITY_DN399_c0_g2_i1:201-1373(-)
MAAMNKQLEERIIAEEKKKKAELELLIRKREERERKKIEYATIGSTQFPFQSLEDVLSPMQSPTNKLSMLSPTKKSKVPNSSMHLLLTPSEHPTEASRPISADNANSDRPSGVFRVIDGKTGGDDDIRNENQASLEFDEGLPYIQRRGDPLVPPSSRQPPFNTDPSNLYSNDESATTHVKLFRLDDDNPTPPMSQTAESRKFSRSGFVGKKINRVGQSSPDLSRTTSAHTKGASSSLGQTMESINNLTWTAGHENGSLPSTAPHLSRTNESSSSWKPKPALKTKRDESASPSHSPPPQSVGIVMDIPVPPRESHRRAASPRLKPTKDGSLRDKKKQSPASIPIIKDGPLASLLESGFGFSDSMIQDILTRAAARHMPPEGFSLHAVDPQD